MAVQIDKILKILPLRRLRQKSEKIFEQENSGQSAVSADCGAVLPLLLSVFQRTLMLFSCYQSRKACLSLPIRKYPQEYVLRYMLQQALRKARYR